MKNIKNIVFDLGGVVVTLDRNEAARRFVEIGLDQAEEILGHYHQTGIFLDLEEGKLSEEEFFNALRKIAGKYIPDDAIRYAWLGFIKDVPLRNLDLLDELRKKYTLYLLSNTNTIVMNWACSQQFSSYKRGLHEYFDGLYLSYKIGFAKPRPEIFEFMLKDSGMIPSETLFIDDGSSNIEVGKQFGLKTFLATNGEDFSSIFNDVYN